MPLITGFIGAIVGAGASIITMYLQTKCQNKRERMKLASQVALEDFKLSIETAKTTDRSFSIIPITCYAHFHLKLLELLETG